MASNTEKTDDQTKSGFLHKSIITMPVSFDILINYMSSFTDLAQQLDENKLKLDTVKEFLELLSSNGAPDTELEKLKSELDATIQNFESQIFKESR